MANTMVNITFDSYGVFIDGYINYVAMVTYDGIGQVSRVSNVDSLEYSPSEGLSTGAILAIVFGSITGVLIGGAILFIVLKK